jgi:hypothetical protein
MNLLNKGLNYNLRHNKKQWQSNLALEAEAAVARLPANEQERVRHLAAHKLYKHYSVPLATEPGISLTILPLMRILQRNLKRTYLIV